MGIYKETIRKYMIGHQAKQVVVNNGVLDLDQFYIDAATLGATADKPLFEAQLEALPIEKKNGDDLIIVPGVYKIGAIYGLNAATKGVTEIEFNRGSKATYFDKNGLIQEAAIDMPRIDFDPLSKVCRGYLMESASVNLVANSGAIPGSAGSTAVVTGWSKGALLANGRQISAGQNAYATISKVASTSYVFSAFVKLDGSADPTSADFSINMFGTILPFSKKNLGNGVYRVWATLNSASLPGNTVGIIKESGSSAKKAVVTQYQLEPGIYPSSLIPTGVSTMIRAEDKVPGLMYGIEWDNATGAVPVRIGNPALHRSLPIHSKHRACVVRDDKSVAYYLDPKNWTKKENGSPSDLTGADGQVQIELPALYARHEFVGTIDREMWSEYSLPGFTYVPKDYAGAFEGSVDRNTSKLASVMNTGAQFRGGNNSSSNDDAENTLLGRPSTAISRDDYDTYAKNRGAGWDGYNYHIHARLFFAFAIEYCTFDSQAAVNHNRTQNGYKQGGLGAGCTNLVSADWVAFNGYYPIIPCGYSNVLANGSGEVAYRMPSSYPVPGFITYVNRYRGVENPFGHIWKWLSAVNVIVQSESEGGLSKVFVANDLNYNNNNTGYEHIGNLPRASGYVKELIFGASGSFLPKATGGSASSYFFDNFYASEIPASGETLRGLCVGGYAAAGVLAGLACVYSSRAPSAASADIGSRLCLPGDRTSAPAE